MTKNVVAARVKAPEPLSKLSASLSSSKNGHADVTARFHSVREDLWRARLRRGRQLATGRNHLYVTVRTRAGEEDVIASDFTVAGGHADLVHVRRPRVGTQAAPVQARIALEGGRLRARLNGRNVRGAFERRGDGRIRTAELTVHNGLRFGRNRLVVTAFTREGRYERVRRTFHIRRDRPLADAGRDRTAPVGKRLRLDGRKSRPAQRGSRLAMRWRVVDKPKGSKPKLRRTRDARPRLVTDVEGHYTLSLRARGPGAGSAGKDLRSANARGARPTAAGRTRASGAGPTSLDTVTVAAQPDVLPSGVPVVTIAHSSGKVGIQVGDQFNPGAPGQAQVMVLDRETLELVKFNTFSYGNDNITLGQYVADIASGDLVIMSGAGAAQGPPPGIQQALSSIGATYPAQRAAAFNGGNWSVVGVRGTSPGSAYQLIGRTQGSDPQEGALSGFLQLDSNDNFTFTWAPEDVIFDTHAPSSTASENVISVNGKDYPSLNLEPGQSGVQILWLEADTLELHATWTYLNEAAHNGECPPPISPPQCLWAFVGDEAGGQTDLQRLLADPDAMVLITTIGKPNVIATQASWALLAGSSGLPAFGANPQVLLGLDGTGDYSFVGVNGLGALGPNRGAEVSQALNGAIQAPRLAGTFKRNRQGLLVPAGYGSPGPGEDAVLAQPQLKKLLAEPAEPFPAFDGPGEQAALEQIAQKLELPVDPKFGIRANYWRNDSITWSDKADLMNSSFCNESAREKTPCTPAIAAVMKQLNDEFPMVGTVSEYFTGGGEADLNGLLKTTMLTGSVSLQAVQSRIEEFYDKPPTDAKGPNALGIIEGAMTIGSGFAGAVPEVGGLLSAPFRITAGTMQIMQAFETTPGGSALFDPVTFEQQFAEFANDLSNQMTQVILDLDHVADLLVSDWGRLQKASALVSNTSQTGGNPGWGLSSGGIDALTNAIQLSQRRYMWSTLLAVPVNVVSSGTGNPTQWGDHGFFGSAPSSQNLAQVKVPATGSNPPIQDNYWYLCRWNSYPKAIYPSEGLLNTLLNSPSDSGGATFTPALGFFKERLYAPALRGPDHAVLSPGFVHEQLFDAHSIGYCHNDY
ncbi:MAG: hypothetical protein GEU88_13570 [Solirubrobacterales bacterium]|nr:hypothetical protein [Solirubrobacterales bacterium]